MAAAIRNVEVAKRFQDLLMKELHHRVKNMLATVAAITSQSLGSVQNLEEGRLAVEGRLAALGRAHDLLLESNRAGAKLSDVIHDATEPFDNPDVRRFVVQDTHIEVTTSFASGKLTGVMILEKGYDDKTDEAWVVVGISDKTIRAAHVAQRKWANSNRLATRAVWVG